MATLTRWMLVPALLGWLVAAAPVGAQSRSEFVNDEAGFFSKEAKAKANAEIARLRSQVKKELVVDTVVSVKVPGDIEPKDTAAVNRFFDQWSKTRASQERVDGVYVVIVQNPPKVRVLEGNKTKQSGKFTEADRQELKNQLVANLKEAYQEGMKNHAKNDLVLLTATTFVHERMSQHASQVVEHREAPAVQNAPQAQPTPWVTYLLIGIFVFLVIWLIMGVLRAISGAGAGPGMAGAGGGGGGFFSSMLGGLFGAAAGMWLYNSFFGGHSSSAWGAGPDGATSSNDADTSYTGGGADYGDTGGDQSGGDAGGGDWGGGGGDFGGGGGDFGGGGGGGDW